MKIYILPIIVLIIGVVFFAFNANTPRMLTYSWYDNVKFGDNASYEKEYKANLNPSVVSRDIASCIISLSLSVIILLLITRTRSLKDLKSLKTPKSIRLIFLFSNIIWLAFIISAIYLNYVWHDRLVIPPWNYNAMLNTILLVFLLLFGLVFINIGLSIYLHSANLPVSMWTVPRGKHSWVLSCIVFMLMIGIMYCLYIMITSGAVLTIPPLIGILFILMVGRAAACSRDVSNADYDPKPVNRQIWKNILIFTSVPAVILIAYFTWAFYVYFKYDLFKDFSGTKPAELTTEQKVEDVKYLYDLMKKYYPFNEAVVKEKGLDDFFKTENAYLEKVRDTKNNKEFVDLIDELIKLLSQGSPHSSIEFLFGNDPTNYWIQCLTTGQTIESQYFRRYWVNLLWQNKFFNYDLNVQYKKGEYTITEDYSVDDLIIPKGAKIQKIDGLPVSEYIKTLQNKTRLMLDPHLKRVYSSVYSVNPFLIAYANPIKRTWFVEFAYNGETLKCNVPKRSKFRPKTNNSQNKNIIYLELTSETAYLRVSSFNIPDISIKIKQVTEFFTKANGKYKKFIIDLRGNDGGTTGGNLVLTPFIKKPVKATRYAAVKKEMYDAYNNKINSYVLNLILTLFGKSDWIKYDLSNLKKIKFSELPENIKIRNKENEQFYYLKWTSKVQPDPDNQYNFDGDIYVLADQKSFSGSDAIVRAHKGFKTAKIVGAYTCGGGAAIFWPFPKYELPNSHILFYLELDMCFNDDGTISGICCTMSTVIEFLPFVVIENLPPLANVAGFRPL